MQNVTQHVNIWPLCMLFLSASLLHSLTLCASLCFSVFCFFSPSIVRFQEFSARVVRVWRPKQKDVLSLSFFPFLLPLSFHHLMKTSITKYIQEYLFLSWSHPLRRLSVIPIKGAPEGWLFDPAADHDLWPPCWSWDIVLPSSSHSPPGGNGLLWQSGLYSHGETHYCSHMAGLHRDWCNHVRSIF